MESSVIPHSEKEFSLLLPGIILIIFSHQSLHGTSLSFFQHPTWDNAGEKRDQLLLRNPRVKKVTELPDSYTSIHPAVLKTKNTVSPKTDNLLHINNMFSIGPEFDWLESVRLTETVDANVQMT